MKKTSQDLGTRERTTKIYTILKKRGLGTSKLNIRLIPGPYEIVRLTICLSGIVRWLLRFLKIRQSNISFVTHTNTTFKCRKQESYKLYPSLPKIYTNNENTKEIRKEANLRVQFQNVLRVILCTARTLPLWPLL